MEGLDAIFRPRSVAVIGASTQPHKTGGRRFRTLVDGGFAGPIYPINPRASEVLGVRAYPSILDVPGPVDLAMLVVPPEQLLATVDDCIRHGVRALACITAGFAETGDEGRAAEAELVRRAQAGGSRLTGPNSAGLYSAEVRLNLTGWGVIPEGPIAVVSQSGNMGLSFLQLARRRGVGFSKILSIGNAADVRWAELLGYLAEDRATKTILLYMEGLLEGEGVELMRVARQVTRHTPVVVLKAGGSEAARRSARSHTGALASEDRVVEAAFRQASLIRVRDSVEAFDAAAALATAPRLTRPSVAILSDGGGHATIVAEAAERQGLAVPLLSDDTRDRLDALLPARAATGNPVDFVGLAEEEPALVARCAEVCLADPEVGGVLLVGHFGGYGRIGGGLVADAELETARALAELPARYAKPLLVHSIYGAEPADALDLLKAAGIPVHDRLEATAEVAAHLAHPRASSLDTPPLPRRSRPDGGLVAAVIQSALDEAADLDPYPLLETESRALLATYGIPVPQTILVRTPDEAAQAAETLGVPLALKVISRRIVHKSDVGGVQLDVVGPLAAADAFAALQRRVAGHVSPESLAGILLTPMAESGLELIVGAVRDPQFGGVAMLGLGGVLAETLRDVAFRVLPLREYDPAAMVAELGAAHLLRGGRGGEQRDLASLTDVLVRLTELAADEPRIAEIEINPLILYPRGAAVVDARVLLRP